jgi:hypothetical protein
VKRTSWSQGLSVTADGRGVVPLAGSVAVRLLADQVGLTDRLSPALRRPGFVPGRHRLLPRHWPGPIRSSKHSAGS